MLPRFLLILACLVVSSYEAVIRTRSETKSNLLAKRDDDFPARLPYVFPPAGTDPIADEIRARRVNGTLLALDGVLLNAPLVAQAWNTLFGVIRDNNTIPGNMRELFITRIAVLNNASYEWIQHEPVGRSEGLTTEQLDVIRFAPAFDQNKHISSVLGPELVAALAYVDASTRNVHVSDEVFANLHAFLSNKQMVEAAATVGGYNLVSRFVVSNNVDVKMDVPVPDPE